MTLPADLTPGQGVITGTGKEVIDSVEPHTTTITPGMWWVHGASRTVGTTATRLHTTSGYTIHVADDYQLSVYDPAVEADRDRRYVAGINARLRQDGTVLAAATDPKE